MPICCRKMQQELKILLYLSHCTEWTVLAWLRADRHSPPPPACWGAHATVRQRQPPLLSEVPNADSSSKGTCAQARDVLPSDEEGRGESYCTSPTQKIIALFFTVTATKPAALFR